MMALEPITRAEQIMSGESLTPITREEMFLAKAAGQDVQTPTPITRREMFLSKISANSSGGDTGWVAYDGETVSRDTTIAELEQLQLTAGAVQTIGSDAFRGCKKLVAVDLPSVTTIEDSAFYQCTSLRSVDLPVATSIGNYAFYDCTSLTSVDLPVATSIAYQSFYNCRSLTSVYLPVATSIDNYAFNQCTHLTFVDLPVAASIGGNAFAGCTSLSTLILRNTDSVCQLIVTAVLGTKIVTAEGAPTGEGFIYVPSALYEGYVQLIAYQAAQLVGDAATAEYIARAVLRKIEDYPEICG